MQVSRGGWEEKRAGEGGGRGREVVRLHPWQGRVRAKVPRAEEGSKNRAAAGGRGQVMN